MALFVSMVAGGCAADAPPGLRFPGQVTPERIAQGFVPAGGHATFGSIVVCGADDTMVQAVTLTWVVGEMAVSDFAIRPNPQATGGDLIGTTTARLTSPLLGVVVTGPGQAMACDGGSQGSEILVEVEHPGTGDACASGGLDVHYASGTTQGVLHVPLQLQLGSGATVTCPTGPKAS